MLELCNATESGKLKRGSYNFEIEKDEEGNYFTYKMVEGGWVCGRLREEDMKEVKEIWETDKYCEMTKLIIVSDDKKTGTLSFLKQDFYLQVPYVIDSLTLEKEWSKKESDHYDKFGAL